MKAQNDAGLVTFAYPSSDAASSHFRPAEAQEVLTGIISGESPPSRSEADLGPRKWYRRPVWLPNAYPAVSRLYYQPAPSVIGDDYQRHVENRQTGSFRFELARVIGASMAVFWQY